MLQGRYGDSDEKPVLPQAVGVEGVGRVVGGDTGNVPEGTLVVLVGLPQRWPTTVSLRWKRCSHSRPGPARTRLP